MRSMFYIWGLCGRIGLHPVYIPWIQRTTPGMVTCEAICLEAVGSATHGWSHTPKVIFLNKFLPFDFCKILSVSAQCDQLKEMLYILELCRRIETHPLLGHILSISH